jgi:hypothetical protein
MRVLRFIVNDQFIEKDPNCDFSGLVPGTKGYLTAEFIFSKEWDGFFKVAAFYSVLGTEYPPQVLEDGKTCLIPEEALKKRFFRIQIIGRKLETRLKTNKIEVYQNGGKR